MQASRLRTSPLTTLAAPQLRARVYLQECVIPARLLCQAFDPEAPGSAYSTSGPCATCQPDTVPVFATNGGNFEFAGML